ncbi:hypothetical protein Tco_1059961 [Tanacetum coccineum]
MLLCKQEEAGVQLNAEQADWKDDIDDDQELEAHYMYMAHIQEVTPDPVDNSGPIFDDEPMHKLVEIILFIVDSGCSKRMTRNLKLLTNFVEKFLGMVKFGNDQIAPILGYGDLVQGTFTIKRVYYAKGLNHNLFSVGQFCDADLEVDFRKSTYYICDLKANDLLTGSRGTDLYSITLQDSSTPNLICLMAKATSVTPPKIRTTQWNGIFGSAEVWDHVITAWSMGKEAGVQLNAEQADWKDDTDDESDDQELIAHYIYMAQIQEVTPDPVDSSGPIFDDEPMHKFQAELDKYKDVNYASKVEIDCAKAKGDLMSYKIDFEKSSNAYTRKIKDLNQNNSDMKMSFVHIKETISIQCPKQKRSD